jgi:fructose-specific phosphotransferase system component IIB
MLEQLINKKLEIFEKNNIWIYKDNLEEYIKEGELAIKTKGDNIYSRDNRNIADMYANLIVNGWLIEDTFIYELKDGYNISCELNGSDKERKISGEGNFYANADLIILNKKIELQNAVGNTIKLKENKVKNCVRNKTNIVIKLLNNRYIYLNNKFISGLRDDYKKIIYKNKDNPDNNKYGWLLNVNKLHILTMEELVKRLKG